MALYRLKREDPEKSQKTSTFCLLLVESLEHEIGGGCHLNIGSIYRVGQVEIGHSSKTSLIQETKGGIYHLEIHHCTKCKNL